MSLLSSSESRERYPVRVAAARGENGAVDEATGGAIEAEVDLIQLAVLVLVDVALDTRRVAGSRLDGVADAAEAVEPAVRLNSCHLFG